MSVEVGWLRAAGGEEILQEGSALLGAHIRDGFDAMIELRIIEDVEAGAHSAAFGIIGAVHEAVDACLHHRARAHGAGLDGHI